MTALIGLLVFPLIAWMLSGNRRVVNWRVVGFGIGLQMLFGFFVFRSASGRAVFATINSLVVKLVNAAMAGPEFLFGPLALGPGVGKPGVGQSVGFILAFQALPTIIVFSAIIAILYHVGVMQLLIRAFAWVFTKLLRISGAESLCASSNIFVGVESAFTIRPHIREMTRSELTTVLTVCMATVASNVMASYVMFLQGAMPGIAGHLVSASILSAPAALMMSKLICPETETPKTLGEHIRPHYEKEDSLFAAVISGAEGGLKLIFGIAALLVAVVGLLAVFNAALGAGGWRVNEMLGVDVDWSVQGLLAYVFLPVAYLMGVAGEDVHAVATLLAERVVLTEFSSYLKLSGLSGSISERSATIAAYALCGFAHIPSIAIFVGGISAIVPEKKAELAAVAWRAFIAATLACLMTGAVAGVFYREGAMLISGS